MATKKAAVAKLDKAEKVRRPDGREAGQGREGRQGGQGRQGGEGRQGRAKVGQGRQAGKVGSDKAAPAVEGARSRQGCQGEGQRRRAGGPRAQRQRAGDRRVAREGEDDQEVPRPRLRREGVGRSRQGSARKKMGIDIEHGFQPEYVVIETKKKVLAEIKAAAAMAGRVLLAPDPDREGEAIAWHIAEEVRERQPEHPARAVQRDHEEGRAARRSLRPMALDVKKFESQQARRILDRLVGYEISPVLWTKVRRGLSAGRVQSVAVRLVVEREAEIKAFVPAGVLDGRGHGRGAEPAAVQRQGDPARRQEAGDGARGPGARGRRRSCSAAALRVASVERKERRKNPPAPFITSQAAAGRVEQAALLAPSGRWALAQRLYEGVELGDEGPIGLITYMRTDSTRISDDALDRGARVHRREVRPDVPAGRADRLQDQEERAGRARGDPADRRSSTTRRRCARCGRAARAAAATSASRTICSGSTR